MSVEDPSEHLETYKRRRAMHKGKVTIFKNYLSMLQSSKLKTLPDLDLLQLKNRLEMFKAVANAYDENQTLIEEILGISDDQLKEREQFESDYQLQLALAMQLIRDNESSSVDGFVQTIPDASGTKAFIKLPTIDLPRFSGEYHNWLEFRDTFESLIHKNTNIDNIQKFHYLRASLQDEASQIIKSLELSSDNYRVAWELITDRYNNTRQLISNHVHALFNITTIQKESAASLRQLLDTVNKNLRALDNLGEATQNWDTLIIYLVASKLDPVTLRYWEELKNTLKEMPKLHHFKTYLKDRADLLQNMEESKQNSFNSSEIKSHKQVSQSHTNTQHRIPNCLICKAPHYLFSCPTFKQMPVEKRIERVSKLNVCSNCLHQGHETKSCRGGTCKYCPCKHNSMLHLEQPKTSHTTLTSTQHSSVLLSTTLVNVVGSDGVLHRARALLDNASTSCYITKDLCTRLNAPLESVNGSVTGINHQHTNFTHRTNIQIQSIHNAYTIDTQYLVLETISSSIPSMRIHTEAINLPKHLRLADPQFYEPAPIDLLLGANIFWQVIGSGRIQLGKQLPTLQETEFGWLVAGCTPHTNNNTSNDCFFTDNNNTDQLSRFWELDSMSASQVNDPCDSDACEVIFTQTTTRQDDGRFVVTIPFKKSPECLGNSFYQAKKRFLSIENRMNSDPVYKQQYGDFMTEYIDLGHMSPNNTHTHTNTNPIIPHTPSYYLPHHGITNPNRNKFRSVFDGSCKTSTKLSLNDLQMVGPVVQDDLISILIRFRQHKYIISADIEKMFRHCSR